MKKRLKYSIIFLLISILILGYIYYPALNIVTGYSSKNMASGVFMANRDQFSMMDNDNGFFPISLAKYDINKEEQSVTSSLFGLMKRKSIYVEGLGAVLVHKNQTDQLHLKVPNRFKTDSNLPYP